jgi:NADP-dependent 3-hydroxy acid dehydrogenase YdfG
MPYISFSAMSFDDIRQSTEPQSPPLSDTFWDNKSTLSRRHDTYPFIDPYRFRNTLRQRIVVVTLAHRGIGRTTANAFAAAGACVVLVGPSFQALQPIQHEIRDKYGTPALALTADILDLEAPKRIVALTEKHLGPIDVLVNITAPAYMRPFAYERDMSDWWLMMERTVRAPVALIHAVLPSMLTRRTGTIITVASIAAVRVVPFMSGEGAAKAAILKFHQHLDRETRNKGITSFAVNPGVIPSYIHDPEDTIMIDPQDFEREPRMQSDFTSRVREVKWDAAGLASGTFVALCADPRAKILSGLYIDAGRDLEEMIVNVEGDQGRVERERLYTLKVDEF